MSAVTCKHCAGTGKRELTVTERQTVEAVGKAWRSVGDIQLRLDRIQGYTTMQTALCNRLVALEKLGIVERRPVSGRVNEWRAVPPAASSTGTRRGERA